MKVAIIGNCQSQALANCFERSGLVTVSAVLDVNMGWTEEYKHAEWAVANKTLDLDYVLTQPISQNFPGIATTRLKEIYGDRLLTYTNIFFEGLHPDITYFGSFGERVASPLGDYHSRIALMAYFKDLSAEDAIGLYQHDIYEKLGYFRRFDESKAALEQRDQDIDIKFAANFFALMKREIPLYSVNHPTPPLVKALASQISKRICGEPIEIPSSFFSNSLVSSNVWPIYPEIGINARLDYSTPMLFWPQSGMGNPPLTLREFVQKSYESYNAIGKETLLQEGPAQQLKAVEI